MGWKCGASYRDHSKFHATAPGNYFTPEMLKGLNDKKVNG